MLQTRRLAVSAIFALALFSGALLTACGDDEGDSPAEDDAGVLSALSTLDKAGLHDIDTSINDKGEVPATARSTAQKLQTLVALTTWPDEFQGEATALTAIFADMAKTLDGEKPDTKAAGPAAAKAHDAAHDFADKVWGHLQAKAKVAGASAGNHTD